MVGSNRATAPANSSFTRRFTNSTPLSARPPGWVFVCVFDDSTAWGAEDAAVASKITIFRGAHLRQYRDPDTLARGVADTVHHEIAHHFGISDARLDELARERHGR